ncbi:DUF6221 family protein [Nonomuraea sp. NEAU-A123]|uniref:DUF6221 family protein n=1 Tax=Nonomuraea sp. NEAU-A123 TaxID=2839649 RepID=UPI001BE3D94B|nr:DUF6221 family protein [Nonomuraea sp. NEAU-A123]MBT2229764.1 hypothetical protein [Nonomuraea sp. NEAU-A123]
MNELIAFLRARLNEDERGALAASPVSWPSNVEEGEGGITVAGSSGDQSRAAVAHLVRYAPARVLQEIEAKRRILDELTGFVAEAEFLPVDEGNTTKAMAFGVVRLLALPYADHAAYLAKWRP